MPEASYKQKQLAFRLARSHVWSLDERFGLLRAVFDGTPTERREAIDHALAEGPRRRKAHDGADRGRWEYERSIMLDDQIIEQDRETP